MAPDCTNRHPVRPIVALQRRMRFSARLAGFCRDRCHQRRARRAERASFSVFVSNPDFRVPRLRPIGERALTGPCSHQEEVTRETQNRGRDYRGVAGPASSGPVAARASFMSIFAQHLDPGLRPGVWHPVSGRCFPEHLKEAKVLIERWRQESNRFRPLSSLGYRPPAPEPIRLKPAPLRRLQPAIVSTE